MSDLRKSYAHIELRVDVKDIVEALQNHMWPGVVNLEQVDVDEDTIWAGDEPEDPQDEVILHITRDRGGS